MNVGTASSMKPSRQPTRSASRRAQQHEPATDGVGRTVDAVHPAVLHRWVVVGEQADVDGFVHHPTEASSEAGQHEEAERADEARQAGQDGHRSPRECRQRHHVDPVAPVGVVADRHHEHDHEGSGERAHGDDGRLRHAERVTDVGGDDAVRHLVELVDHVEQEEHQQWQGCLVADGLLHEATGTLHRPVPLGLRRRVVVPSAGAVVASSELRQPLLELGHPGHEHLGVEVVVRRRGRRLDRERQLIALIADEAVGDEAGHVQIVAGCDPAQERVAGSVHDLGQTAGHEQEQQQQPDSAGEEANELAPAEQEGHALDPDGTQHGAGQ